MLIKGHRCPSRTGQVVDVAENWKLVKKKKKVLKAKWNDSDLERTQRGITLLTVAALPLTSTSTTSWHWIIQLPGGEEQKPESVSGVKDPAGVRVMSQARQSALRVERSHTDGWNAYEFTHKCIHCTHKRYVLFWTSGATFFFFRSVRITFPLLQYRCLHRWLWIIDLDLSCCFNILLFHQNQSRQTLGFGWSHEFNAAIWPVDKVNPAAGEWEEHGRCSRGTCVRIGWRFPIRRRKDHRRALKGFLSVWDVLSCLL